MRIAFKPTRENASQFSRAARAGKLLRCVFEPMPYDLADRRVTRRLTGAMVKVIKKDTTHLRGQRTVMTRASPAHTAKGSRHNKVPAMRRLFVAHTCGDQKATTFQLLGMITHRIFNN